MDRMWWGVEGKVQEGGEVCVLMADLCHYMAEANIILYSDYPPIKNKLKKNKTQVDQMVED